MLLVIQRSLFWVFDNMDFWGLVTQYLHFKIHMLNIMVFHQCPIKLRMFGSYNDYKEACNVVAGDLRPGDVIVMVAGFDAVTQVDKYHTILVIAVFGLKIYNTEIMNTSQSIITLSLFNPIELKLETNRWSCDYRFIRIV